MILDVYIQYDRDSTLSSAGASIPTFDGTETRGLCAPIEFGNLVKNVINSRDVVLEWSTGTTTSLDLRMVRTALDEGGHQDVLLPLHENNTLPALAGRELRYKFDFKTVKTEINSKTKINSKNKINY